MNWIIEELKVRSGDTSVVTVPADKSITHRAIMIAALSKRDSILQINNVLPADDCMSTVRAFISMGVQIEQAKSTGSSIMALTIRGVGIKGLQKPDKPIDAGNSGTTVRLLSGILAGQDMEVGITGDQSLSSRPMKRIIEPLRQMGIEISARDDNFLPLIIKGRSELTPIDYKSKIASAQIKSCVLFAGMHAKGKSTYTEPVKSRDHTERMLTYFGLNIAERVQEDGCSVSINGPVSEILPSGEINIPGDISAASFFFVLGSILPSANFIIKEVGINPTRSGILDVLQSMGADISIKDKKQDSIEPAANIEVKSTKLKPCNITEGIIPRLIDEVPIIALAATQADGRTEISGAAELRVKESDRLKAISSQLNKMGANIEEKQDGLVINGPTKLHGAEVESFGDHRIAMTLAIAALIAKGKTVIKDVDCISISFPDFKEKLQSLGVEIQNHPTS